MAKMSRAQYLLITKALADLFAGACNYENQAYLCGIKAAAAAIGSALKADNRSFNFELFMSRVSGIEGVDNGEQG